MYTDAANGVAMATGSASEVFIGGPAKLPPGGGTVAVEIPDWFWDGTAASGTDPRGRIGWCFVGVGLGGTVGEHSLHGPWILRWGFGAALGGTLLARLWDALRPR